MRLALFHIVPARTLTNLHTSSHFQAVLYVVLGRRHHIAHLLLKYLHYIFSEHNCHSSEAPVLAAEFYSLELIFNNCVRLKAFSDLLVNRANLYVSFHYTHIKYIALQNRENRNQGVVTLFRNKRSQHLWHFHQMFNILSSLAANFHDAGIIAIILN